MSLAKPMSVIAVGRAMAEGHIDSLDEPAANYFQEWRGTPRAAITVRHLLGMRSGLGNRPPADTEWDNTYLINTLLRGLDDQIRVGLRPQPLPATQ